MKPFDSLAHAIVVVASVEAGEKDWSDRVPISTELMLTSQLKEEVTLAVTVMAELVAAEANSRPPPLFNGQKTKPNNHKNQAGDKRPHN